MHRTKDKYVWQCRACGSRAFEIQGPTITNDVVRCVKCHAEMGTVDEFLAAAEARMEREDQERRKHRFH